MFTVISLGLSIALIVIGLLAMAYFSVINIYNGKHNMEQIVIVLVPLLIFIISYLLMGTLAEAGILTMLISIGIMVISILFTGIRSNLNF